MSAVGQKCWRALRRFHRSEVAAAAVEFALVLPIMLLLYIGTTEAGALISMDRKVQTVSGTIGDLVARSNETLTRSTLLDYFQAASGVMTPYSADPLEQTVSQVRVANNGDVTITWSWQYVDGVLARSTEYAVGDEFELPDAMVNISLGQNVIVAETRYSYLPLYGLVFDQAVALRRETFYMPRFGGGIVIE